MGAAVCVQVAVHQPAGRVVPSAPSVSPEQIKRACEGDDGLLAQLVGEIVPPIRLEVTYALRRHASRRARDAEQDVDDFVQDVLVHLLGSDGRRLVAWDPGRGRSLRSFVRLLARHRIARVLGGRRGNPWEGGAAPRADAVEQQAVTGADAFERTLSRQQLSRLLERLQGQFNERSALLFEYLYIDQRPVAEVCEQLGMTRGAVDQWNVRLRKLVRRLASELDRMPQEVGAS